jgi:hypothetical protein
MLHMTMCIYCISKELHLKTFIEYLYMVRQDSKRDVAAKSATDFFFPLSLISGRVLSLCSFMVIDSSSTRATV